MPKVASVPLPATITTGQLARLVGVSERVILGRKADGRLPRSADGGIDLRQIVQAGVTALAAEQAAAGGGSPIDNAKLAETQERTRWLRLRNEMLEGDLIPAAEMEAIVGAAMDAVRAKILAIPSAYGPRLAAEVDPNGARETLTGALHEALSDLAEGEVVDTIKDRTRRIAGRLEGGDETATEAGSAA